MNPLADVEVEHPVHVKDNSTGDITINITIVCVGNEDNMKELATEILKGKN